MLKGPDGKCLVCGVEVSKILWCDPCWEIAKARVLRKYKAESERKPEPAVDLSIKDALGLEFKPGRKERAKRVKEAEEAKE